MCSDPTNSPPVGVECPRREERDREAHVFPVESHRQVVNLFLDAVNQRRNQGFAEIASDQSFGKWGRLEWGSENDDGP